MPDFASQGQPVVLLGASGGQAGLWRVGAEGEEKLVGQSFQQCAVYAAAVSPDGNWVALGLKSQGVGGETRPGFVQVVRLNGDATPVPSRYFATHGPVYAVDWLDSERIIVGTHARSATGRGAGDVIMMRVMPTGAVVLMPTPVASGGWHAAPVVAVRALSKDRFLSVGLDGAARIWRLPDCTCLHEVCVPAAMGMLPLLPSLVVMPDGSRVLVQFPSGHLRVLEQGDAWGCAPVLEGDPLCGGVTCLGEKVLVADWESPRVAVLNAADLKLERKISLDRPARTLVALSPEVVAAVHPDGTASMWSVGAGVHLMQRFKIAPVRSLAGGLSAHRLAAIVADTREKTETARLENLRQMMEQAREIEDIRQRIHEVTEQGLGFEGLVLLADWCRRNQRPTAEVQVRAALCRDLPPVPESAMHLRIHGELLLSLDEPRLALPVLRRAAECDPKMADLAELLSKVEGVVGDLPQELPTDLWEVQGMDQTLRAGVEEAQSRVLLDLAVGRAEPRIWCCRLPQVNEIGVFPAMELDLDVIVRGLQAPGECSVLAVNCHAASGLGAAPAKYVRFLPGGREARDHAGIEILCEFKSIGSNWIREEWVAVRVPGPVGTTLPPPAWTKWARVLAEIDDERQLLGMCRRRFGEMLDQAARQWMERASRGAVGATVGQPATETPPLPAATTSVQAQSPVTPAPSTARNNSTRGTRRF